MEKASRWITNFLLGKKDERNRKKKKKKRNSDSFAADNLGTCSENSVHSGTPTLKLRLSFGKQTGRTKRVKKRELEEETDRVDHNYVKALTCTPSVRAHAAATKIQAVYRAHLARKALQALKGLVKIQALVRGHLVRKQTAATVKSIQALMAIQVRARAQRIQTMKEGQPREGRKSSSKHLSNHNLSKKLHGEKMGMNLEELRESLKSRSEYLNHSQAKKMQHELKTYYSKQKVFVVKKQVQDEKYSINSEPNSPQHYPYDSKPISSYSQQIFPSFMANTESSQAKVRSQSEPKQRPETNNRGKIKRIESVSGMSSMESDRMTLKNHDLWFMKVQSSARSSKEKNYDSVSHSNSRKFNASYEPPVSIF